MRWKTSSKWMEATNEGEVVVCEAVRSLLGGQEAEARGDSRRSSTRSCCLRSSGWPSGARRCGTVPGTAACSPGRSMPRPIRSGMRDHFRRSGTSPSSRSGTGGRKGGGVALSRRLTCGQSTVEAALLLPSLMLVTALLAQPVCLSYTRAIMRAAAAECARAAATAYGGDLDACRSYALRRLEAVPEVSPFHVGGRSDWNVSVSKASSTVDVTISGHARPLPLMGVLVSAFGAHDARGVVLEVSLHETVRPSWLGGDYGGWQSMWG